MSRMNNTPDIPKEQFEKYSAAVSLSDMEIFVFPELLFSLVLANIMSPRIWAWKEHNWFRGLDKMKPYKKIQRLKQFIIDNYEFNLDLDTWGLTTKESEIARFAPFMDEETISRSNALFGYEGDKHYFTLDIRKHFGLDKYTTNVIPYWKTETLEAMDAFKYKDGYRVGAGECVSLSTLYAAALFIVCDIPLEDIFLLATPLHSQNFINVNGGILTNNRRLVTKTMWFNGTDLSAKAQRALRNEQVTIVANNTGFIHTVYPEATIDPESFALFRSKLDAFTTTEITFEIIANFLRDRSEYQTCFQIGYIRHGKPQYLPIERAFAYEHSSPYKVSDDATRDKLLEEIDEYDFYCEPIADRILLNKLSDYLKNNPISHFDKASMTELAEKIDCTKDMSRKMSVLEGLIDFIHLEPELPNVKEKRFNGPGPIAIKPGMQREEIIEYLKGLRASHPVADLAFYASRDLSITQWGPFLQAALDRNPVVVEKTQALSDEELIETLANIANESVYDGSRVAQPDEVWNFQRGDGVERAIALADVWKKRHPETPITLRCEEAKVTLQLGTRAIRFESRKGLIQEVAF
ncbi:MAG: hypothetical protein GXY61_13050 [Lentisphaerae bacterium]|jgi:hypothetical protein|nr:hypothetical protein [Lentisphaerota bacterium]